MAPDAMLNLNTLQNLPNELLYKILSDPQLGRKEWKCLRLVHRRLAAVVNHSLFDRVKVFLGNWKAAPLALDWLLANSTFHAGGPLARHIRKLSIESSTPDSTNDGATYYSGRPGDLRLETLKRPGFPSFNSLENVTTVNWTIGLDQLPWDLDLVFRSISSLPSLSNLSLHVLKASHSDVYPLHHFHSLRSFSFAGHFPGCDDAWRAVLSPLQQALCNCPDLTDLRLLLDRTTNDQSLSLRDFLRNCGITLRITNLALRGFDLRLSEDDFRHLVCLRSIELADPKDFVPPMFWRSLYDHGIRLREINAVVDDSLVAFLEEYSGLRKLVLNADRADDGLARRFYKSALPHYFQTLEILDIRKAFCGDWCIGYRNEKMVAQCVKLHTLCFCFSADDLVYETGRVVEVLRDLTDLTSLQRVCLSCALHKYFPGDRNNTVNRYFAMRGMDRVQAILQNSRIISLPGKPARLPAFKVEVGEYTYHGVKEEGNVMFRLSDSLAESI